VGVAAPHMFVRWTAEGSTGKGIGHWKKKTATSLNVTKKKKKTGNPISIGSNIQPSISKKTTDKSFIGGRHEKKTTKTNCLYRQRREEKGIKLRKHKVLRISPKLTGFSIPKGNL